MFDTSLSEEGIVGRAVGMAISGLMPVAVIQFRKYADPATEQLNNCGTMRWRTANRFAAPIVVRMPGGFGKDVGDPWHSLSSEVTWAHAVGWQVCIPSNAADAVGLLRAAMRSPNPTIFFEHRSLLMTSEGSARYPGDDYVLPFGVANTLRRGTDVSVITWGALVHRCVDAAQRFGERVELIDLRTVAPWDKACVLESVRRNWSLPDRTRGYADGRFRRRDRRGRGIRLFLAPRCPGRTVGRRGCADSVSPCAAQCGLTRCTENRSTYRGTTGGLTRATAEIYSVLNRSNGW